MNLAAGAGLRTIQDALGHKSIAMTVRYSHLAPDFLSDVVAKLVPKPTEGDSAVRTAARLGVMESKQQQPAVAVAG